MNHKGICGGGVYPELSGSYHRIFFCVCPKCKTILTPDGCLLQLRWREHKSAGAAANLRTLTALQRQTDGTHAKSGQVLYRGFIKGSLSYLCALKQTEHTQKVVKYYTGDL